MLVFFFLNVKNILLDAEQTSVLLHREKLPYIVYCLKKEINCKALDARIIHPSHFITYFCAK